MLKRFRIGVEMDRVKNVKITEYFLNAKFDGIEYARFELPENYKDGRGGKFTPEELHIDLIDGHPHTGSVGDLVYLTHPVGQWGTWVWTNVSK